jgi:hypothetical protein
VAFKVSGSEVSVPPTIPPKEPSGVQLKTMALVATFVSETEKPRVPRATDPAFAPASTVAMTKGSASNEKLMVHPPAGQLATVTERPLDETLVPLAFPKPVKVILVSAALRAP